MVIRSDVCVVGAGPAGLTIAGELRRAGLSIALIESGLDAADPEAQDLSAGVTAGDAIHALDLRATRNRQVGGNANIWSVKTQLDDDGRWIMGVRYGTLMASDLRARSWVPNSGWPIGYDELGSYYDRARAVIDTGPAAAPAGSDWYEPMPDGPLVGAAFRHRLFEFGPSSTFTDRMVRDLRSAGSVEIVTGATAVELVRHEPGTGPIRAVAVRRRGGEHDRIEASTFVLASGAVENARLLLVSERPQGGVGNEHDLVGRYFMDHPLFSIGDIVLRSPDLVGRAGFYDFTSVDGRPRHGHAVTSDSVAAEQGLLAVGISLFPRPRPRHYDAVLALKALVERAPAHERDSRRSLLADVVRGADHLPRLVWMAKRHGMSMAPGFGRGGWSIRPEGMKFTRFEVVFQCEQAPNREARVMLDETVDRHGSPRPRVEWKLGAQTRHSVRRTKELVAGSVESTGFGRFVEQTGDSDDLPTPASMAHHAGTTRMGSSPLTSVVDATSRVHTVPNLYVAGSSVFPTSSYVNPTLTVVALSIRLADEIRRRARPVPLAAIRAVTPD